MSRYNFFVSYCQKDGLDIALQLSNSLSQMGYTVYMNSTESQHNNHTKNSIDRLISESDYFISILTEGYATSCFAMKELEQTILKADSRGTPVFSILTTNCPIDLPTAFRRRMVFIQFNTSKFYEEVNSLAVYLDKLVGNKIKATLLYEKLSEYQKLNNRNKVAETICKLIEINIEGLTNIQSSSSEAWELFQELLNLYERLSQHIGCYDQESYRLAEKILSQLNATNDFLNKPSQEINSSFENNILFACVAIRLIYFDKIIRSECYDTLYHGKEGTPHSISEYVVKQHKFTRLYSEYNTASDNIAFDKEQREFITATQSYIFVSFQDIVQEKSLADDIFLTLIKWGYTVDSEVTLGKSRVDLAIRKYGKYIMFIECNKYPISVAKLKKFEKYAEELGAIFHVIYAEDWVNDRVAEIQRIKCLLDVFSSENDSEILVSIAKFIQEGNNLFDLLRKKGLDGEFKKCLRESYERLKNYCDIVGATDIASDCAERIVEIRSEADKTKHPPVENDTAEKGIKTLLGITTADSGYFDVFISFKNEDSDLAERIYNYSLEKLKYPFWSKKTLPSLSESDYSKAIENALDKSKHFVVVLSDLEYLDSKWVSYEMETFHNEIREGRKEASNFIIVATDDVYDRIIQSNKKVLNIAYRKYQIIKMSEYKKTLVQYLS